MLKLSRGGKFLTGVVFVFCLLSVCFGDEERLVSSELLKAGGLKIVWENKMPIGKKESLEELLIFGNRFLIRAIIILIILEAVFLGDCGAIAIRLSSSTLSISYA